MGRCPISELVRNPEEDVEKRDGRRCQRGLPHSHGRQMIISSYQHDPECPKMPSNCSHRLKLTQNGPFWQKKMVPRWLLQDDSLFSASADFFLAWVGFFLELVENLPVGHVNAGGRPR